MIRRIPAALALAVLGAHFFRSGLLPLVLVCVALIGVTFVPRRWAGRTVTVALLLGAAEWMRTLFELAAERQAMGQPATRLVLILGGVALFTFLAAVLVNTGPHRRPGT